MLDRVRDLLDPPLRDSRIVFIHVAKCGGTSLVRAIADCFKPWRSTQRGSVVELGEHALREAAGAAGIEHGAARKALLAYHLAATKARLVAGHYRYSRAVFERYHHDWSFVTMLRQPVARWYSNYYFNASRPPDDQFHIGAPIEEFIETERATLLGTELVRSFADLEDDREATSSAGVSRAIEHLRHFTLVGTLEDLPAFTRAFGETFGCSLDIPRLNVTPADARKPRAEVAPEVAKRVRELCDPDLRVFRALFPGLAATADA
jgi:hypothetical protein